MPIIAYALTSIRWQKRANYIGTRPQQLRRTDEVTPRASDSALLASLLHDYKHAPVLYQ